MDSRGTNTGKNNARQEDKIKQGPCAQQFEWLETCARRKNVINQKQQLQACPNETDHLIKCTRKHPLYFQS